MQRFFRRRPSTLKGLVAGLAAGLAGTIVMSQFQGVWSKASDVFHPKPSQPAETPAPPREDATMKAAGKLAHAAGYETSSEQRKQASPLIHYGFGTAMGAVYGMMHEFAPRRMRNLPPMLPGAGYGTALFVGADEVAVPALGLSASPASSPMSSHIYGLASHLVYGLTVEVVHKAVRKNL